jgi:hypothetical protein
MMRGGMKRGGIFRLGALVAAAGWLFVGCSGTQLAKVTGRVTLDGAPLADGVVTFEPAAGTAGPEFSGMLSNGEYKVAKEVLPGDYAIKIRSWQKTGRIVKSPHGEMTDEIVNAIPERYWGPKTELSAHLKPGANTIGFDLLRK